MQRSIWALRRILRLASAQKRASPQNVQSARDVERSAASASASVAPILDSVNYDSTQFRKQDLPMGSPIQPVRRMRLQHENDASENGDPNVQIGPTGVSWIPSSGICQASATKRNPYLPTKSSYSELSATESKSAVMRRETIRKPSEDTGSRSSPRLKLFYAVNSTAAAAVATAAVQMQNINTAAI